MTKIAIGTEEEKAKNSPAEKNSSFVFQRARVHHCRSWVKLMWFLNGNGHTNFQRALLKFICTAWAALTVRPEKQGKDGRQLVGRQLWTVLGTDIILYHLPICSARAKWVDFDTCIPVSDSSNRWPLLCTWAVVSGGEEGIGKRKKVFG